MPNFRIEETAGSLYLTLRIWHATAVTEEHHSKYFHCAQRIIRQFFNVPGPNDVTPSENSSDSQDVIVSGAPNSNNGDPTVEPAPSMPNEAMEETEEQTEISIDDLYMRLRDAHIQHDNFDRFDSVQHGSLLPTLTSYQRDAVQWMLHRETGIDHFPSEYIGIRSRWPPDEVAPKTFYYHPRKIEITDRLIPFIDIPCGGILAEEMGLGKTVETLSLILLNRRPSTNPIANETDDDSDNAPLIKTRKRSNGKFMCICQGDAPRNENESITCTKCDRSQHRTCVLKYVNEAECFEDHYICPECWHSQPLVHSGATFIVSPASIKMQWHDEIVRHIMGNELRVFIYDGINKKGWISPRDMASYDVVITDYTVMSTEIHFANQNKTDRLMRNPALFMKMQSPLMMIDWWRVCLDEAQMVESANNNSARMVKLLPAQHRWAVTGTPLEKSIHDLYGLLFFLDCEPYDDHRMWMRIAQQFVEGE